MTNPASPSPAPMAGETPRQIAERVYELATADAFELGVVNHPADRINGIEKNIEAALTAAQKRADEAVKALQPFANIARLYAEKEAQERQHQRDAGLSEDAVVKPDHHRVSIALGDCRKALASLQGSGA